MKNDADSIGYPGGREGVNAEGIASSALGTILVVILSAYIGCAGLMDEYAIQSIDKEQRQVYRVVAELGGGRCVAVSIKEENGEWVDSGSITSLNVFDGYRIIKEED